MELYEFPPTTLTDYLVQDLGRCYDLTGNRLLLRVNLAWLLEIQLKKVVAYYDPDQFKKAKGSHNILRSIYTLKDFVPELKAYIDRLYLKSPKLERLSAIQTFDYVSARYNGALEVFASDLPLVEDMFELYWILSNHTRDLNIL